MSYWLFIIVVVFVEELIKKEIIATLNTNALPQILSQNSPHLCRYTSRVEVLGLIVSVMVYVYFKLNVFFLSRFVSATIKIMTFIYITSANVNMYGYSL